jgi:hypothetical protein
LAHDHIEWSSCQSIERKEHTNASGQQSEGADTRGLISKTFHQHPSMAPASETSKPHFVSSSTSTPTILTWHGTNEVGLAQSPWKRYTTAAGLLAMDKTPYQSRAGKDLPRSRARTWLRPKHQSIGSGREPGDPQEITPPSPLTSRLMKKLPKVL